MIVTTETLLWITWQGVLFLRRIAGKHMRAGHKWTARTDSRRAERQNLLQLLAPSLKMRLRRMRREKSCAAHTPKQRYQYLVENTPAEKKL